MSSSAPLKRVSRACDYCRKKRLKCTGQRPCMNCQLYGANCSISHQVKAARSADGSSAGGKRKRASADDQTRPEGEMPEAIHASTNDPTHLVNNAEQRVPSPRPWSSTIEDEMAPLFQTSEITADFEQYADDLGLVLASSWPSNPLPSLSLNGLDAAEDLGTGLGISPFPTRLPTPRLNHVSAPSLGFQGMYLGQTANPGAIAPASQQASTSLPPPRSAPGLFLRKSATDSKFIGVGSIGSTLSECLRYSISTHGGSMEDTILNHLVNGIRHVDELTLTTAFERPPLPAKDLAERGVAAYYSSIHFLYPIMEEEFLHEWHQVYEDNNYALSPVAYSRLCLVVAVGNLVSQSRWDINVSETVQQLHRQVWSLLDRTLASPFMDSMQVLLLHTVFLLYCGKTGIAWLMCGTAVRIAHSLGLHQPSPPKLKLSVEHARLRSRLWLVAYTLDAFLSLSEGRPSAITGSPKFGPSRRSAEQECSVLGEESPANIAHDWLIDLAVIANEVTTLSRNGESLGGTLAQIADIDAKLLSWKDAIPMESRPDQQILTDVSRHYFVAMLHLKYHNLMRTLHWISLSLSSQEIGDDFPRLPARVRSSESICLNSARSVVEVLNGVSSQRIAGRLGGFIVPYCMAAISIFYRHILKDPSQPGARTSLEQMRNGTLHITTLLDGVESKSHFRSLFEKMLKVAEDVVNKAQAQSVAQQEGTLS